MQVRLTRPHGPYPEQSEHAGVGEIFTFYSNPECYNLV